MNEDNTEKPTRPSLPWMFKAQHFTLLICVVAAFIVRAVNGAETGRPIPLEATLSGAIFCWIFISGLHLCCYSFGHGLFRTFSTPKLIFSFLGLFFGLRALNIVVTTFKFYGVIPEEAYFALSYEFFICVLVYFFGFIYAWTKYRVPSQETGIFIFDMKKQGPNLQPLTPGTLIRLSLFDFNAIHVLDIKRPMPTPTLVAAVITKMPSGSTTPPPPSGGKEVQ